MTQSLSPSELTRLWFEQVWNQRDESAIDRMLSSQADLDGLHFEDSTVLRGPQEFKMFHRSILSAIPDLQVTISKIIEQGDWVAVRFVCEGTHSGPGLGIEPQGNRVHFSAMVLGRIENGMWVEGWNNVDFQTLQQQAGGSMKIALPSQSAQ